MSIDYVTAADFRLFFGCETAFAQNAMLVYETLRLSFKFNEPFRAAPDLFSILITIRDCILHSFFLLKTFIIWWTPSSPKCELNNWIIRQFNRIIGHSIKISLPARRGSILRWAHYADFNAKIKDHLQLLIFWQLLQKTKLDKRL